MKMAWFAFFLQNWC